MKKLFIAACMMLGFASFASAQAVKATTSTVTTTKSKGKVVKMNSTNHVAATGLKADGTPDKRLKANKITTTTPAEGPKKKDGTADMRFKANKKKAAATK